MSTQTALALAPLAALALGLVVWCLVDIARSPSTRYLPRWAWAVLCLASFPAGVLAYLLLGREHRP
ncbi:PLD nuclease N-terminal domain-containing protein [Arsenicicoccus sp. oral taxon 190]|uniref:PLD nuclease N-terminal domain-containing protein n=1 Tax=Arsenicicoccus sp. oral taxon 190 TaxID=1658671 RepID=UPI000679F096|nr:PLD nuclease N-terminal domain-containing protein [Arsenicicoccus sp. oral taxon 190]AKT51812.1 hypothetical protein ADJ73_11945 [Arsenicicoccus sp. oral taxon 190]